MGRLRIGRRLGLGRTGTTALLTASVLLLGVGLYWFQPWKLVVDETVRESLPSADARPAPGRDDDAGTDTDAEAEAEAPAGPREIAGGELISHEHATTGRVRVLELPDGSRTLRLEGLDTSNGPALEVWVTDAPVKEGRAGWHVFDDGKYVSLGALKGNKGDQNYALPAGLDLSEYTSVSIWCARFHVSFGAAPLTPTAA